MPTAFVIRPFGVKSDAADKEIDFDCVHNELIGPALDEAGFNGGTTGDVVEAGNIREDMFELIISADLVICDITVHNANVFYELGIRQALRRRGAILIKGAPVKDAPPFDILTDRYLQYEVENPSSSVATLAEAIEATVALADETTSPLFRLLPRLKEVDFESVRDVPRDFAEELERAQADKSAGWLRLLATEVADKRFRWPALRLVAKAQFDAKDYKGARRSWEAIRDNQQDDVGANLALANVFERMYRESENEKDLTRSDHAIDRVLEAPELNDADRAEALALRGRNFKSRWRLAFENLDTLNQRRGAAANKLLRRSYEAYYNAYRLDLNHFYSGMAALQMCALALDLATEGTWVNSFETDDAALDYTRILEKQMQTLQSAVPLSIQAVLDKLPPESNESRWANISAVDVMFLTGETEGRVRNNYADAVPANDLFYWDSVKGQLELFSSLGLRTELADQIVEENEARIGAGDGKATEIHAIVFAGHRVDQQNRDESRFPPDREDRARDLIQQKLSEAKASGMALRVYASAAPGADILCHEVCDELEIESVVCLPMPVDEYGRQAFEDLDSWKPRYLSLVEKRSNVLELSDQSGLPRWLQPSDSNAWERGNRWVLELAQTAGASRVSLVALWDGKAEGDDRGGTAHVVKLAQEAGTVFVDRIDSSELLI